jgi:TRAP-type C4-dicarboxylate transport system permease small subunit
MHDPHFGEDAEGTPPRRPLGPLQGPLTAGLEVLGGLALAALLAITVADALMRSGLNRPILGGGDLVQVALVLVVASAVPLSIAAGRAIAIEMLVERLPPALGGVVRRAAAALCAVASGYLAWRCYVNAGEAALFGETTMLLQIPYGPFYGALALSFALSALLFASEVLRPGPAG